jgi:ABC-type multidrug transport system permease subunit
MILNLSKRLEREKLLFEKTGGENSYSQRNANKKSFIFEIIFLIHMFFCTVLVLYAITITTHNEIEKEINETRRELFYELGYSDLCKLHV